jgi:UDP-glucose 4-epimerase
MKNILLTGGTGYIGSHTAVELFQQGYNVIILDNLCNSDSNSLKSIYEITKKEPTFIQGDIRNYKCLIEILDINNIDAVIHFAGLKSVRESFSESLNYYSNNVQGTITLLRAMEDLGIHNLVFSSSASVYGHCSKFPLKETDLLGIPTSPYGNSKSIIETILKDISSNNEKWKISSLRYFNPIGGHPSGLLGEKPRGSPNNVMPILCDVGLGKISEFTIFGGDYPTFDGTCLRDYIHVSDLAIGHISALKYIQDSGVNYSVFNLGVGKPYSVLELVKQFEYQVRKDKPTYILPYKVVDRRKGDVPILYADCSLAKQELDWNPKYTITDMCKHAWEWAKNKEKWNDSSCL